MTQDPTALQLLAEQLTRERDEMRAQLARTEQLRERLEQQATALAAYREEMRARQGTALRGIEMLLVQRQFDDRLGQALAYQQGQIESTLRQAGGLREALLALEIRIAAVDKLRERRVEQAAAQVAVREQKRSDEWAQQQFWQRREAQTAHGGGSALGFAF